MKSGSFTTGKFGRKQGILSKEGTRSMTWSHPGSYCSFSKWCVLSGVPESAGVYGLFNSQQWLYIGKSRNLRRKLLECLNEGVECLAHAKPTGFIIEVCPADQCQARQEALTEEFQPLYPRP